MDDGFLRFLPLMRCVSDFIAGLGDFVFARIMLPNIYIVYRASPRRLW